MRKLLVVLALIAVLLWGLIAFAPRAYAPRAYAQGTQPPVTPAPTVDPVDAANADAQQAASAAQSAYADAQAANASAQAALQRSQAAQVTAQQAARAAEAARAKAQQLQTQAALDLANQAWRDAALATTASAEAKQQALQAGVLASSALAQYAGALRLLVQRVSVLSQQVRQSQDSAAQSGAQLLGAREQAETLRTLLGLLALCLMSALAALVVVTTRLRHYQTIVVEAAPAQLPVGDRAGERIPAHGPRVVNNESVLDRLDQLAQEAL